MRLECEEQSERRSGTGWQRFRTACSPSSHVDGECPARARCLDGTEAERPPGISAVHVRQGGPYTTLEAVGRDRTGQVVAGKLYYYCLSEPTAPSQSQEFLSLSATALLMSGTQVGTDLLDKAVFLREKQGHPVSLRYSQKHSV